MRVHEVDEGGEGGSIETLLTSSSVMLAPVRASEGHTRHRGHEGAAYAVIIVVGIIIIININIIIIIISSSSSSISIYRSVGTHPYDCRLCLD